MRSRFDVTRVVGVLCVFLLSCSTLGCMTITHETADEKKQEDITSSQKALVVSFLNRGLTAMAYKELRQYLVKYPNDADFKNLMGLTQLAMNNSGQAIGFFQKAYEIDNRVPIGLNLSSAYIEAGKYPEAIKLLLALKTSPDTDSYPHPERISHNLGLVCEKRGKFGQAEKYYKEALSMNPAFFISQMRLGQVYERQGKTNESLQQFAKAAQTCPVCFDPVNALTASLIANGNSTKATQILKNYLKVPGTTMQDKAKAKHVMRNAQQVNNAPVSSPKVKI